MYCKSSSSASRPSAPKHAAGSPQTEEAETALDEALAIIQGCHATYLEADPELRRLMNQGDLLRLLVRADIL